MFRQYWKCTLFAVICAICLLLLTGLTSDRILHAYNGTNNNMFTVHPLQMDSESPGNAVVPTALQGKASLGAQARISKQIGSLHTNVNVICYEGSVAEYTHIPLVTGRIPMAGEEEYVIAIDRQLYGKLVQASTFYEQKIILDDIAYRVVGVLENDAVIGTFQANTIITSARGYRSMTGRNYTPAWIAVRETARTSLMDIDVNSQSRSSWRMREKQAALLEMKNSAVFWCVGLLLVMLYTEIRGRVKGRYKSWKQRHKHVGYWSAFIMRYWKWILLETALLSLILFGAIYVWNQIIYAPKWILQAYFHNVFSSEMAFEQSTLLWSQQWLSKLEGYARLLYLGAMSSMAMSVGAYSITKWKEKRYGKNNDHTV